LLAWVVMTQRQPLQYQIKVARRGAGDAIIEAEPRSPISGGPPPEFGGDAQHWSPEHLLVASAALCYWNTLEWFARRHAVPLLAFECRAEGQVEKTDRGLAFTGIRLDVVATGSPQREAELRDLLQVAKKSCLVANSLACPVDLVADVVSQPPSPTVGETIAVAAGG
jgi:organic hydroperoxide reductase OsmC/OhrA